ncbi:MAG: hypothetical protein ACXABY_16405 [Candidatus Thorarchaeota archaeon]|jgi:hypothetical protein
MIEDDILRESLAILGFKVGTEQESRAVAVLRAILKIQGEPPVPRAFAEVYESVLRENPEGKLSKAWVHRVLKPLIETKLVRVEGQSTHRKRYIADVNTIMAGLEQLKTNRLVEIDKQISALQTNLDEIVKLDCGVLAQQLVTALTGKEQTPTTRIVRGVEELDRVLRYNVTSVAKKGDIIRATVLWLTPLLKGGEDRMMKFIDAAQNGAEIRYLVTIDVMGAQEMLDRDMDPKKMMGIVQGIFKMREAGVKFDVRVFPGVRTYSQVSLNNQSTALVITENPLTATWLTRDFNPDLIDNAVSSFDKNWESAKSLFELTSEDFAAMGAGGGTLAKMLLGEQT